MKNISYKLIFRFTISVFIILTSFAIIIGFLLMFSGEKEIHSMKNLEQGLIFIGFISVLLGTILSLIVGKGIIHTIIEINEATKEIANGNYNIRLNENNRTTEFHEIAHNFNIMTRQLSNTEILRNDFMENVSHEIKTPLATIEGYASLLQNKNLSTEKKADYIHKIIFNTKRLSTLTGNILLLSQLENQEVGIQKEKYELDEQIRMSILTLETEWSKKNIEFDIEFEELIYYGNKELLDLVWYNIILNAIKYSKSNTIISIKLVNHKHFIQVSISDQGCGMNEETIHRIFEKFYQFDNSRATNGNGLGLSLTKRIIDMHSGSICVHSKIDNGSTFIVELPKLKQ